MPDPWVYDSPRELGWYAVLKCWDADEGYFPDVNFWDGQDWREKQPVVSRSPDAFATEPAARKWAGDYDPEC